MSDQPKKSAKISNQKRAQKSPKKMSRKSLAVKIVKGELEAHGYGIENLNHREIMTLHAEMTSYYLQKRTNKEGIISKAAVRKYFDIILKRREKATKRVLTHPSQYFNSKAWIDTQNRISMLYAS